MFLKRTAIIMLSTLFLTVGCVSISTDEEAQKVQTTLNQQTTKITELENSLTESQQNAQQKQADLEKTKADLEKIEHEKSQLAKQLKQKIAKAKSEAKHTQKKLKTTTDTAYQDKTILGQAEWIYVNQAKENFRARIDTGAATSSINAVDIQEFERDGKNWVKFNISHNKDDKNKFIEARVIRFVRILQASEPGEYDRRPVVELSVRIGGVAHKSEFTLTDRQHMEYPVLIGRSFIKDIILVDVSQDYIHPKYQAPQDK